MDFPIIKLDATDSTNTYLRHLMRSEPLADYTVVKAREQRQGRGQMGAKWQSEPGKNLTFSVLRNNLSWPARKAFDLNVCVSLAIFETFKACGIPDLSIKWPNDILSGSSKLGGILIENQLAGSTINSTIIGIGLNVNQTDFANGLRQASSLKSVAGHRFDLDEMLQDVLENLKSIFDRYAAEGADSLWDAYERHLFKKGILTSFEDGDGLSFKGCIEGVNRAGKLIIAMEDGIQKEFGLKEVKLLY